MARDRCPGEYADEGPECAGGEGDVGGPTGNVESGPRDNANQAQYGEANPSAVCGGFGVGRGSGIIGVGGPLESGARHV